MSMNGFCRKEEGKAERDSQDGRDEMGKGRKEVSQELLEAAFRG